MTTLRNSGLPKFIISHSAMGWLGWSCPGYFHGCSQLRVQLGVDGPRWPYSHIWDLICDVWNGWDSGPLSPWRLSWAFPCWEKRSKRERTKEQNPLRGQKSLCVFCHILIKQNTGQSRFKGKETPPLEELNGKVTWQKNTKDGRNVVAIFANNLNIGFNIRKSIIIYHVKSQKHHIHI